MSGNRRVRRRLAFWGLLILVYAVGYLVLVLLLPDGDHSTMLVDFGVLAVGQTGWLLWRQRRDSRALGAGRADLPKLERRMRRGEVPEDPAERRLMRELAQRRLTQLEHGTRWAVPVLLGVWALLTAVLFVREDTASGLTGLGVGAAAMGLVLLARQRNLRKLHRARFRLGDGPEGRTA